MNAYAVFSLGMKDKSRCCDALSIGIQILHDLRRAILFYYKGSSAFWTI